MLTKTDHSSLYIKSMIFFKLIYVSEYFSSESLADIGSDSFWTSSYIDLPWFKVLTNAQSRWDILKTD